MSLDVTVAIPVRDGAPLLEGVFAALAKQTVKHELLVCDSGSRDGSLELARAHGATVLQIPPSRFSHGGTRNLLIERASTPYVALLTQDAEPADAYWLERLLSGFSLAADAAIVYGAYRARPDAAYQVRIELERWFGSLSPDGEACIERLSEHERALPAEALLGRRGFFSDVNACVARDAWRQVPFREVPYAEDRVLAIDMLRAGYAKAFVPSAVVLHSHNYTPVQHLRRCFDEWRALREVYGWREPAAPTHWMRSLRGELRQADRDLARSDMRALARARLLLGVAGHHMTRLAGASLGSRADRLPATIRRWLSLERRPGFSPLRLESPHRPHHAGVTARDGSQSR